MGISDWFFPNPGKQGGQADQYLSQIPGQTQQYYNPYMQAGQQQIPGLEQQYGQLTGDPGGFVNKIGQNYHQSPGFQFALQQALQAGNHASAAGGMAGSPQNQQWSMQTATGLANQDYNNYLQNALGSYGMGLQGEQDMFHTGYNAANEYGQTVGNSLASRANLNYAGQQGQNQQWGSLLGGALGAFGSWAGG